MGVKLAHPDRGRGMTNWHTPTPNWHTPPPVFPILFHRVFHNLFTFYKIILIRYNVAEARTPFSFLELASFLFLWYNVPSS